MKYYINLSGGLLQGSYKGEIIRIQSSHLESHAFNDLFYTLSDSLLYHLAMGFECCIIDCTSNNIGKVEKRFVPICNLVLSRRWDIDNKDTFGLGKEYAERIMRSLNKKTKKKIDYYKKFKPCYISLSAISINVNKEIVF